MRRLHAKSQEAQAGDEQDDVDQAQAEIGHQRHGRIGPDFTGDNPPAPFAADTGRLDEIHHHDLLTERARQAEDHCGVDHPGGHYQHRYRGTDGGDHDKAEHDGRQAEECVIDAADDHVDPRGRDRRADTHHHADEVGQQSGREGNSDRPARAKHQAAQDITVAFIRAQPSAWSRHLEF